MAHPARWREGQRRGLALCHELRGRHGTCFLWQATVFAFGQTGSGKTCTMAGHGDTSLDDGNALGLCAPPSRTARQTHAPAPSLPLSPFTVPRHRYALAAADVMAEAETRELSVGISFYEVYRGQARAPLGPVEALASAPPDVWRWCST